jgi:hypothetical protein
VNVTLRQGPSLFALILARDFYNLIISSKASLVLHH